MITPFEEFIQALSKDWDIELEPEKNALTLLIDERLTVQLEWIEDHTLLVGSFLCELPPGAFRREILKKALMQNALSFSSGILAYCEENNQLALFLSFLLDTLTYEAFSLTFASFCEKALLWKDSIEKGNTSPDLQLSLSKEKSSLFDLSQQQ